MDLRRVNGTHHYHQGPADSSLIGRAQPLCNCARSGAVINFRAYPIGMASITPMRTPCDSVSQSTGAEFPCQQRAKPWVLTATILASSMAFIDSTAINIALPSLQASFHATVVDVQWVVESYGLLLGALILVGGSLGDLYGRRLIFMTGVALFTVASVICGIAQSIPMLITARSLQGLGAALSVPGSLAIISTSFDEKSRGQAIGVWSGFTAITTAIGRLVRRHSALWFGRPGPLS